MDSPSIDEKAIATMNRHRQRNAFNLSPAQRMEAFQKLQASAWQLLQSNPAAMQAFIKRNHRKRRQSELELLEKQMRGQA